MDEEYGEDDENGHTFLFTLNDDYVIDANVDGNIARWINQQLQAQLRVRNEENAKGKSHKARCSSTPCATSSRARNSPQLRHRARRTAHREGEKLWACGGAKNCIGTMQPKR